MMKQYRVQNDGSGKRIDKLLTFIEPNVSRSEIQSWIKQGHVTVNDSVVKANYKCVEGDTIAWTIPEKQTLTIKAEHLPLEIVYEDDDIIVINKPRGMVVHPSSGHTSGTLVNALLYHCHSGLSTLSGEERAGIVHRIDKDTSGLLVVAKTNEAHRELQKQFKNRQVKRNYEAIVHGVISHDHGLIDAPIGRDPKQRQNMAVVDDGRHAVTHFRVIKRYGEFTHIECQLETGRTHQIRVHMKYINHPIVGDPKYGPRKPFVKFGQVLHARSLEFTHPITEEHLSFESDLPGDFHGVLNRLNKMT
ncbi:MAG TPA: RluA family pseudouridine synthase [Cerasibacillus sp.]|uniref:RluA family pseudouridine synthase n=1 Tax=Cerasibacillus sp. TaxID=2498711 RepID=UPI002F3EBF54